MIFHQRSGLIAVLVAATFTLASLVLVLVLPSDTLLSASDTDMVFEFVSSRAYLAESLRNGHLPLWNPFTYGGQPFLSDFESAVLYPPNLPFLWLPLARALNFSMLLHLVILGWGTERWANRRGLNPWAAGLAGFFVMPLSGAVFPHLYAGHLSAICTMAWTPWIFLGLETWIWHGNHRGLFLASAAICLQILAGHVQYFFYTAVAAGIQSFVLSIAEPVARRRAVPAVAGSYLTALALAGAQVLTALATDHIRQHRLDYDFAARFGFPPENFLTMIAPRFFGSLGYDFAARFGFPPENLLTIIAPRFFGSLATPVYWGRYYPWEMSLFIGAMGPLLIAIALCTRGSKRRGVIVDLVIAGLLLVLALGIHTPMFDLLYGIVPGFGHFRGWSKFTFPATLFLVLVMATGNDFLLREKIPRIVAWMGLLAGLITGGAGLVLLLNPNGITEFLHLVSMSHESYLPAATFVQPDFVHGAGVQAGLSLGLAGLILITAGVILLFVGKRPLLRWALPGLLMLEMVGFAAAQVIVSHVSDAMSDAVRQYVSAHPGDYRVLNFGYPDNGYLLGAGDLGGRNPFPLRRYAEFINFTQGEDSDHVTQYLPFRTIAPLYAMLRLRYIFSPTSEGIRIEESPTPPLPRLLLVSDEKVLAGRNALFSAMHDPSFNPSKTVLLESEPEPHPDSGATGSAKVVSDLPDELIIEADTNKPALLLITDLYDHDWHVQALPGSAQQSYHLMPADYILRAVPLTAGHHHLRIVYAPTAFSIGIGISVVTWTLWISLLVWDWRRLS
jgi:hypothetical protein